MAVINREKLISLLEELPEQDRLRAMGVYDVIGSLEEETGVVEVPLRMGDEAFVLRSFHGHFVPKKGRVSEMYFTDNMQVCYILKGVGRGLYGSKVFKTEEECSGGDDR